MEDEKKEIGMISEKPEDKIPGACGHHHCGCKGHKIMAIFIKIVIILAVFSIGVSVGAHLNREGRGHRNNFRTFKQGNYEQGNVGGGMMRGGRMMRGNRFQAPQTESMVPDNITYASGQAMPAACGFQGNVGQIQAGGWQMMNQGVMQPVVAPAIQAQVISTTPVAPTVQAAPATRITHVRMMRTVAPKTNPKK